MDKKEIAKNNTIIAKKLGGNFCLAKFHQTTIYLQTGETKSCCHLKRHFIPQNEIKENPSALHNTRENKSQRRVMLEGGKLKGCEICWDIENLGKEHISARLERNATIYTPERLQEIAEFGSKHNINPEYIELSFGNQCNFKCGYCQPKSSSTYWKEIEEYGPYSMVKNSNLDISRIKLWKKEEENPYIKAWWEWWPEVSKNLGVLRITGGEPLMQVSTWKLLEIISKDNFPKLEVNINSNFGIKLSSIERLCSYVNRFNKNKNIKRFQISTSLDTWGSKAEYIRTGLDLNKWEENFHYYLSNTNASITIMITCNILSVTSFKKLLEKILQWRKQYPKPHKGEHYTHRILFHTSYLKGPLQYDMNLLPKKDFMPYMYDSLQFVKDNIVEGDPTMFSEVEYLKFKGIVQYMKNTIYSKEKLIDARSDFYNWFQEHDRRRKVNFGEIFPEYNDFMEKCRKTVQLQKYLKVKK